MSTKPIDYDALAAQSGGTGAVDYDALAAQHGGTAAQASGSKLEDVVGKSIRGEALTPEEQTFAGQQMHSNGQDMAKAYANAFGMAAGGGIKDMAKAASPGILGKVLNPIAKRLYQSALKPSMAAGATKVANAVDTGLTEGIPVSPAGVEKLGALIDDVNDKVTKVIGGGQGKTVNPYSVASRLSDTAKTFADQVNPNADLKAITDAGNEFLGNNPNPIPAAQAQAMKAGTYAQLSTKAYGEMQTAAKESQKALARGIKEELNVQFPELADLNARDTKFYNLEGMLERAVLRQANHQLGGIGTPLAAAGVKAVTGSTAAAATGGFLKGVVDNPIVKSRLAIVLAKAGNVPFPVAMARVNSYVSALGGVANSVARGGRTTQQPSLAASTPDTQ